jgi:hypothetical protein
LPKLDLCAFSGRGSATTICNLQIGPEAKENWAKDDHQDGTKECSENHIEPVVPPELSESFEPALYLLTRRVIISCLVKWRWARGLLSSVGPHRVDDRGVIHFPLIGGDALGAFEKKCSANDATYRSAEAIRQMR